MTEMNITNFTGVNLEYDKPLQEVSINDYFKSFDFSNNIIIISCMDDSSKQWDKFSAKSLLGIAHNIIWRESYIALIDKDSSFIYEEFSKNSINYSHSFPFGVNLQVLSAGYGCTPFVSSIIIEGVDYSKNKRGLNFVIYNKRLKKVVDSFNCDFFGDEGLITRRFSVLGNFNIVIDKIKYGLKLALQYCKLDNNVLYFILNSHLGDAARDLKILKAIRQYYGPSASRFHFSEGLNVHDEIHAVKKFPKRKLISKIVIITNRSISGVARLYENYIDEIIIFPRKELEAIELYAFSQCGPHENIIPDENASGLLQRWNFDETDWTKWMMYKVNALMWKFCIPREEASQEACMNIGNFTNKMTDKIISEYCIDPIHSVIICPVSRSSSGLPKAIWEKFAQYLHSLGYDVFTNTGIGEVPIENTKPLAVDVDVVVCLSNRGAKIVGVQCGLIDILVWSKSPNLLIVSIIKNEQDRAFAQVAKAVQEVNKKPNNVTYLRIEHFEEEYVLKLLMDNFH